MKTREVDRLIYLLHAYRDECEDWIDRQYIDVMIGMVVEKYLLEEEK